MRAQRPELQETVDAAELGAMMREMRENLGHDLKDVAEDLRIRLVYLEAIEAGNLSALPGNAYVSGFIRAYADFLGLDGDEMVRRFRMAGVHIAGQTPLHLPSPVEEGRLPTGAILLTAAIIAGAAYGGWSYFSSQRAAHVDTVAAVPAELSGISRKELQEALPNTTTPVPAPIMPSGPLTAPQPIPQPAPQASPETPQTAPAQTSPTQTSPTQAAPAQAAPAQTSEPDASRTAAQASPSSEPSAESSVQSPAATGAAPASPSAPPAQTAATNQTRPSPAPAPSAPAPQREESASADRAAPAAPPLAAPAEATPSSASPGSSSPGSSSSGSSSRDASPPAVPRPSVAELPPAAPGGTAAEDSEDPDSTPAPTVVTPDSSGPDSASGSAEPAATPMENVVAPTVSAPARPATSLAARTEPAPAPASAVSGRRIVIRALAESYVAVLTADNQTLFAQLMKPGDSYEVPSGANLVLQTGNAGGLQLTVDGRRVPALGQVGDVRENVPLDADKLLSGAR